MMNWISSKDALPANDDTVLVVNRCDHDNIIINVIRIGQYIRVKNGDDYWRINDSKYLMEDIIYWAKLPDLPIGLD
jgi:hypothetical protein